MPLNVEVKLLGTLRGISGRDRIPLKLRGETATVRDVIQELVDRLPGRFKRMLVDPELESPRPNTLILLNGREIGVLSGLETPVRDGDEVVLLPVSHGG